MDTFHDNDNKNVKHHFIHWKHGAFISCGGYTYSPEHAVNMCNATAMNCIRFGRMFLSKTDLVERSMNGDPLANINSIVQHSVSR